MAVKTPKYEIELRGVLSVSEYVRLLSYLQDHSQQAEEDNKVTYFFVTKDLILKVTDDLSHHQAKITVKLGDETKNILEEYELKIPVAKVDAAVAMFRHLGFSQVNRVIQHRINFEYKGTVIALKHTDDWGYHFEVEALASNELEARQKKLYLKDICRELGVSFMTPEQIRQKISEINQRHGFTEPNA